MIAATEHDRYVAADYARLKQLGISAVREGIRWHLIERQPGYYDFSSVLPMVEAARDGGIQVIWDVCHYGWPDDLDIWRPEFVQRYARLARAFAALLREETDTAPYIAPINEISFFSWAAGDAGYLNPFNNNRGHELKVQLVRAAIEGIEAVWSVQPDARIFHIDPVINIITSPKRPKDRPHAKAHRLAQYQAWDMIAGRAWPQLGGEEKYLDVIGVNYYPNNQWMHGGPPIRLGDKGYRPFRSILNEVYSRYKRPMFIAETGTENEARPLWLRYIAGEVRAAQRSGVPLEGVCLYPILNHPGWDNDRHCHNGLWDYYSDTGEREMYAPLAREVLRQDSLFKRLRSGSSSEQEDGMEQEQSSSQPRLVGVA